MYIDAELAMQLMVMRIRRLVIWVAHYFVKMRELLHIGVVTGLIKVIVGKGPTGSYKVALTGDRDTIAILEGLPCGLLTLEATSYTAEFMGARHARRARTSRLQVRASTSTHRVLLDAWPKRPGWSLPRGTALERLPCLQLLVVAPRVSGNGRLLRKIVAISGDACGESSLPTMA